MDEIQESMRRELDAIRTAWTALAALAPAERDRVMEWMLDRWRREIADRGPRPTPPILGARDR